MEIVALIAQGKTSPEVLAEKVHGRTQNKHGREVIIDSLTGTLSPVDIDIIAMYKAELDLAREHKDACLKKMKVQVAIARKLLVAIWFILSTGKPYQDYQEKEIKQEEGNS